MSDRYVAIATDYDGTLARQGRVDAATIEALRRARNAGITLILVTGRELESLRGTFDELALFDMMVLENGATLYEPATGQELLLCDPPPPALIARLRERGVRPIAIGRVIVATVEPHQAAVLEAIRELGLEHQVIFNKGSVMVLPAGVNKASGLREALVKMQLDAGRTVSVGDAENDHALLEMCGVGAAVANALASLKAEADLVLSRDHGDGVAELIEHVLAGDLRPSASKHAEKASVQQLGDHVDVSPNA